jgi:hypothetical protein
MYIEASRLGLHTEAIELGQLALHQRGKIAPIN